MVLLGFSIFPVNQRHQKAVLFLPLSVIRQRQTLELWVISIFSQGNPLIWALGECKTLTGPLQHTGSGVKHVHSRSLCQIVRFCQGLCIKLYDSDTVVNFSDRAFSRLNVLLECLFMLFMPCTVFWGRKHISYILKWACCHHQTLQEHKQALN